MKNGPLLHSGPGQFKNTQYDGANNSANPARPHYRTNDSRFQHAVERVHRLGPLALGELLVVVGVDQGVLDRYAGLESNALTALGGGRWSVAIFGVASS